jgi:uncharacterized protein affecting Mg2+/Co2+ transport
MIVKIVNRSWIELETTVEIAEGMIRRWEITSYETIEGEKVEGQADIVEMPIIKPKNITRKIK